MIPLSDLRTPAVGLDWHEAVAVVVSLTAIVESTGLAAVPQLEDVMLRPDGALQVARVGPAGEPLVTALASQLALLLDTAPCPAELRQLVDRNSGVPPEEESVAAFARGLMFFERPGREAMLQTLAARATVVLERVRAASELERLTERARQQPVRPTVAAPPRFSIETPSAAAVDLMRRHAFPMAIAATVFVAMALVAATLMPLVEPESAPPASSPSDALGDESVERGSPRPPATLPEALPEEAAPASAASDGPGVRPERTPAVHAPAATPAPVPPAPAPRAPGAVDVRVTELGGVPVPSTSPAAPGTRPAGRSTSRVYTVDDPGVQPARLIRPHLPAEPPPDVPPEQVGTLELTVSEQGTVDHVALISPSNRYQERMLVAAAKAWIFQPAMRDGRPVRYRIRIRVTL